MKKRNKETTMKLQDFLELYSACRPLRKTVKTISIQDTAVITNKALLAEAVAYYKQIQMDMPAFILIDWDGKSDDQSVKETIQASSPKIIVYPHTKIGKVPQKQYCLYAQNLYEFWRENGILPLYEAYLKKGLPPYVLIAENCYRQFGKGYPLAPYIESRLPEAFLLYSHFADEKSRQVFLQLLKAYATGDPDYLPYSDYPQYKHPEVSVSADDSVIIDGGALNGSSSIDFAKQGSEQTKVLAFEAVPSLYEKCRENVKNYPNITIVPYALWNQKDTFYIENNQGGSFITKNKTENSETCHSVPLDDYYRENPVTDCSLIKLDIEGAEPECLAGAKDVISRYMPKLQISVYHKIEQFFDIPLYLLSNFPSYKFYLGHHTLWFWETILYAKK